MSRTRGTQSQIEEELFPTQGLLDLVLDSVLSGPPPALLLKLDHNRVSFPQLEILLKLDTDEVHIHNLLVSMILLYMSILLELNVNHQIIRRQESYSKDTAGIKRPMGT